MLKENNEDQNERFIPFKYIVVFLAMVLSVLLLTSQAYAHGHCVDGHCTLDYFGSSGGETTIAWANYLTGEHDWLTLEIGGGGTGQIIYYNADGVEIGSEALSATTITFPEGVKGFRFSVESGEYYAVYGTTNNPNSQTVTFGQPNATCGYDDNIIQDYYYDPSIDQYIIIFNPECVESIKLSFHGADNYDASSGVTSDITFDGGNFNGQIYLTCNGVYLVEMFNAQGNTIHEDYYETHQMINPICNSSAGNEDIGGGDGEKDGSCFCDCFFQSEGWTEHMNQLQAIHNAIPPAPNWQEVANTMTDTIVPRMIDDLQQMLGTAPPPPAPPANVAIAPIDPPPQEQVVDYAEQLGQSEPTMQPNTELEESVYSTDDIVNEAPEIQFAEDESGGFDIMNPIDALPPTTDMPMPGEHAGEWDHQPQEQIELETPIPEGGEQVEVIEAPTPQQPSEPAPMPEQEYQAPPTPGGEQVDMGNYKPHPDAADGSG